MRLPSLPRGKFCIASRASSAHFVSPQQSDANRKAGCPTFINSPLRTLFHIYHSHQICNHIQTVFRPCRRSFFCAQQSSGLSTLRKSNTLAMGLKPEVLPARRWITRSYGAIDNLKLEDISVPPPVCIKHILVPFSLAGNNPFSNQPAMHETLCCFILESIYRGLKRSE